MRKLNNTNPKNMLLLMGLAGALFLPQALRADGLRISFGWTGKRSFLGLTIGSRHTHRPRGHVRVCSHERPRCIPQRRPRVWVPGHYETRVTYVTIEGYWTERWVPATVRHVHRRGRICIEVVTPGHMEKVWVPPRRVPKETRVYIPGHYR